MISCTSASWILACSLWKIWPPHRPPTLILIIDGKRRRHLNSASRRHSPVIFLRLHAFASKCDYIMFPCCHSADNIPQIFTGLDPFADVKHHIKVMRFILDDVRPARPTLPAGRPVSDKLWNQMQLCWRKDAARRPTAAAVAAALR